MAMAGVYRIESQCKPNRVYIGSSVNIRKRWMEHLRDLRHGNHCNRKLQNHYNKYGESDFVFVVIELCLSEFITEREQYYIDTLKPNLNICPTAGNCLGRKFSEETKSKLREAGKGRRHSPETIKKMSEIHKRQPPMSNETRAKLSKIWKGRKHSEESKRKMRDIAKKRPSISDETRRKMSEAARNMSPELRQLHGEILKKNKRSPGYRHSEKTRQKISEVQKGRPLSEETKKKISESNKGKNIGRRHSEETLAKMRRPRSEEGKQNMKRPHNVLTSWNKGKKLSKEHKEKLKGRVPWNKGLKGAYKLKNVA